MAKRRGLGGAQGLPEDDFEPVGEADAPRGDEGPRLTEEQRIARAKANEKAAKDFLAGRVVPEDARVPAHLLLAQAAPAKQEPPAKIPVYRVERDFQITRQLGVTTIRAGKVITARDYDIEALRRMGCELVELPAR